MEWRPGWTELTVTPSAATSVAVTLRKLVTPARATELAMRLPMGPFTPRLVIATTRPQPRSRIGGIATRHISTVDSRLRSRAWR